MTQKLPLLVLLRNIRLCIEHISKRPTRLSFIYSIVPRNGNLIRKALDVKDTLLNNKITVIPL